MKRLLFILSFFFISFSTAHNAFAAAQEWEMDQAHSNVYFSIDHVYSKIHGHFNDIVGKIYFDSANLKESSFAFTIKTDSVDTGNSKRDKHLQSADFFDAGKFPVMMYKSTSITSVGNNQYRIDGKLTVKGKEHDLAIPVTLAGPKDHPAVQGKKIAGFNSTLTLDRLALNVGDEKFYKMGVVGKDVDVVLSIEVLADR